VYLVKDRTTGVHEALKVINKQLVEKPDHLVSRKKEKERERERKKETIFSSLSLSLSMYLFLGN
jgi:hypothetical protein